MRVLVLDTIHGGREIGAAFARAGHSVDIVDVYRGTTPDAADRAAATTYDLVAAPVHLDPAHPLLAGRTEPVITHHEAVRRLLSENVPRPMIEITGAQGKTTTACALASILPGAGVLHTSTGTYAKPGHRLLFRKSITPASVLEAAEKALALDGWLVAEESLGVTGAGELAIITSPGDYRCAGNRKSALAAKVASSQGSRQLLCAPGVPSGGHPDAVQLDDVVSVTGDRCTIAAAGRSGVFTNPLLALPGYRVPLALAGTAAVLLGCDPAPLSAFPGVPGRMEIRKEEGVLIIDNANSGTNAATTIEAARYARSCAGSPAITLVIGTVKGDGAVCEGFAPDQIRAAILTIRPSTLIWVGDPPERDDLPDLPAIDAVCPTLDEAERCALAKTHTGAVVLAVKTWR
ncbi:coenzyme F430 synthase [Methanoregula sp.]|uniref:coenzyme F430 synthase n=1 Tax=Methanoregula sp. TaxID=2052170 RepID=UPI002C6505FF|nr:coenzyme F430 synthase [Methanoregula sp.]HVP95849.1 coenzyme F430 synthase [Methanoregula sp.]